MDAPIRLPVIQTTKWPPGDNPKVKDFHQAIARCQIDDALCFDKGDDTVSGRFSFMQKVIRVPRKVPNPLGNTPLVGTKISFHKKSGKKVCPNIGYPLNVIHNSSRWRSPPTGCQSQQSCNSYSPHTRHPTSRQELSHCNGDRLCINSSRSSSPFNTGMPVFGDHRTKLGTQWGKSCDALLPANMIVFAHKPYAVCVNEKEKSPNLSVFHQPYFQYIPEEDPNYLATNASDTDSEILQPANEHDADQVEKPLQSVQATPRAQRSSLHVDPKNDDFHVLSSKGLSHQGNVIPEHMEINENLDGSSLHDALCIAASSEILNKEQMGQENMETCERCLRDKPDEELLAISGASDHIKEEINLASNLKTEKSSHASPISSPRILLGELQKPPNVDTYECSAVKSSPSLFKNKVMEVNTFSNKKSTNMSDPNLERLPKPPISSQTIITCSKDCKSSNSAACVVGKKSKNRKKKSKQKGAGVKEKEKLVQNEKHVQSEKTKSGRQCEHEVNNNLNQGLNVDVAVDRCAKRSNYISTEIVDLHVERVTEEVVNAGSQKIRWLVKTPSQSDVSLGCTIYEAQSIPDSPSSSPPKPAPLKKHPNVKRLKYLSKPKENIKKQLEYKKYPKQTSPLCSGRSFNDQIRLQSKSEKITRSLASTNKSKMFPKSGKVGEDSLQPPTLSLVNLTLNPPSNRLAVTDNDVESSRQSVFISGMGKLEASESQSSDDQWPAITKEINATVVPNQVDYDVLFGEIDAVKRINLEEMCRFKYHHTKADPFQEASHLKLLRPREGNWTLRGMGEQPEKTSDEPDLSNLYLESINRDNANSTDSFAPMEEMPNVEYGEDETFQDEEIKDKEFVECRVEIEKQNIDPGEGNCNFRTSNEIYEDLVNMHCEPGSRRMKYSEFPSQLPSREMAVREDIPGFQVNDDKVSGPRYLDYLNSFRHMRQRNSPQSPRLHSFGINVQLPIITEECEEVGDNDATKTDEGETTPDNGSTSSGNFPDDQYNIPESVVRPTEEGRLGTCYTDENATRIEEKMNTEFGNGICTKGELPQVNTLHKVNLNSKILDNCCSTLKNPYRCRPAFFEGGDFKNKDIVSSDKTLPLCKLKTPSIPWDMKKISNNNSIKKTGLAAKTMESITDFPPIGPLKASQLNALENHHAVIFDMRDRTSTADANNSVFLIRGLNKQRISKVTMEEERLPSPIPLPAQNCGSNDHKFHHLCDRCLLLEMEDQLVNSKCQLWSHQQFPPTFQTP